MTKSIAFHSFFIFIVATQKAFCGIIVIQE